MLADGTRLKDNVSFAALVSCLHLLVPQLFASTDVQAATGVVLPTLLQARAQEASASAAAGSSAMRCAVAEQKAEMYEQHLAHATEVVDQLTQGIGHLFETAVGIDIHAW